VKERRSKLFGLLVFLMLTFGFVYLMITGSKANVKEIYNQIEINGNKLLSADDYLQMTGLNDSTEYSELTLLDVKTKIEKHPYLRKAEVEFDGVNKILVEVEEHNIKAVLLQKNKLKLITSNFELLPLFPPTDIKDFPVISNLNGSEKYSVNNQHLQFAFGIIDAFSLSDENLRTSLAEINIRRGGDVILTFAGLKFPILFGKNNQAKKALILKNLWPDIVDDDDIEYVDFRFNNQVFIGNRKSELADG
jgi:cell division protein FtsQ